MTRMRWLGHAALLFESHGQYVLIDPYLTDNPVAPVTADEVPADFILVSHGHEDHVGDAIAIADRTGAMVVANYEIATWFKKQGVARTHGMQHGGAFRFPFGTVKMTIAFHGSQLPDGSYGGNPGGFYLTFNDGKRVYDAADTGLFGDMKLIGEEGIDLALLPIGDNFTMGPADALKAVKLLNPAAVVPIHYGTTPEINQDANHWAVEVSTQTTARAHALKPGDWIEV